MSGFPIGFVTAIAIATILLFIVGWFIWHQMFSARTDFSSQLRQKNDPGPDDRKSAEPVESIPEPVLSSPKTVSAADTISNQSDEAVVELKQRMLSNQKTVENAGDVSVSMDEDE